MDAATRDAIDRTNALALFPRLGTAAAPTPGSRIDAVRHLASRLVIRGVARLINTSPSR
jgi:6-methylsalicylate decarboxylase